MLYTSLMQPEQPQTPVNPPAPVAPEPVEQSAPVVGEPVFQAPEQPSELTSEMRVTETTNLPETEPIQWQAPEYVQERRSPWWFIGFWLVVAVLMALAAFAMKSISFAVLVPVMAAALMIYSHRPPRMISYVLSPKGLYINEKLHPLGEFRSFGVAQDESIPGLSLIPVRRFRPSLTVHFPVEAGEAIVDMLGSRIPMQEVKFDVFDRLTKSLHL